MKICITIAKDHKEIRQYIENDVTGRLFAQVVKAMFPNFTCYMEEEREMNLDAIIDGNYYNVWAEFVGR